MWSGGAQGTLMGSGVFISTIDPGNWTQFSAPITYSQTGTPDWCNIIFTVLTKGNILTTAVVDDLSFGSASSVEQIEENPKRYNLSQNYPNPFNPTTNIEYSIPEQSYVELKIYDVLGNEVASLVNTTQEAGKYDIKFDASGLSSGLYIYKLNAGNFTSSRKMMLLK